MNYNKTDHQVHLLSQIIAKFNRTYVAEKEDDSHTNLDFDPLGHRLYGRFDGADSEYSNVPALEAGRWIITEKWKGAVLPMPDFEKCFIHGSAAGSSSGMIHR